MKKQIAKILSLALVAALSLTSFAFASVTLPSDVQQGEDKALQQAVTGLMETGAITGDTDGLFHPEQSLTRAQVCKILVTLAEPIALNGTPTQTVKSNFSDLRGYSWAAPYIAYAAENNIALGYGNGTFKPGADVTVAELVTFTIRACGYSDKDLGGTWPQNYMQKAEDLKLFSAPIDAAYATDEEMPAQKQKADKRIAAIVIANAMDKVKKDVAEEQPQGTDKDKAKTVPDTASMTYATGKFNDTMTTYAGKAISSDAVIYTYGFKKDYAKDMSFSSKATDYTLTTIDKYKLVTTPAWYKIENGKITQIVVPADTGFTGRIYCVVNGTTANAVNAAGDKVAVIDTLTAMKSIKWLGDKKLNITGIFSGAAGGQVYELKAVDGEITNVATPANKTGKIFAELGPDNGNWVKVLEKDGDMVKIAKVADGSGAVWVSLASNAAVYKLDNSGKEYDTSRLSQVKKDALVRLYDISDDDEPTADIVVISNGSKK